MVETGSGSIDLTGLTFVSEYSSAPSDMAPVDGYINVGASVLLDGYTSFSGPTTFGSGSGAYASCAAGPSAEIVGSSAFGEPILWVPLGYVSDTSLSDSSIYDGATFASLGVTPGTYEWTWGTGPNQNFTLQVPVPEPLSLSLFGAALAGAAAMRRRRRKAA